MDLREVEAIARRIAIEEVDKYKAELEEQSYWDSLSEQI